jgi:hypothetical protein
VNGRRGREGAALEMEVVAEPWAVRAVARNGKGATAVSDGGLTLVVATAPLDRVSVGGGRRGLSPTSHRGGRGGGEPSDGAATRWGRRIDRGWLADSERGRRGRRQRRKKT